MINNYAIFVKENRTDDGKATGKKSRKLCPQDQDILNQMNKFDNGVHSELGYLTGDSYDKYINSGLSGLLGKFSTGGK